MNNNECIRPLTPFEKQYATEKHHLVMDFLKRQRLDAEEFYDIVVFDFLLSVEVYLNNKDLQKRCNFEAVAYMYMKRAIYRHFRKEKALKRCSEAGADISMDSMNDNINQSVTDVNTSMLEYMDIINEIKSNLTEIQQIIFSDKLLGYSLKEIADNIGITPNQAYKQFAKVKKVVTNVMNNSK